MHVMLTRTFLKVVSVLSFSLLFSRGLLSQEADMGLYRSHPLAVNPSYTGDFNGDWRLALGYRSQQVLTADPYKTAVAAFDGHFYIRNQQFGAGVYVMNDVSGIGGLTYNTIHASLAYSKEIANHYFGLGIQGGFVSATVNDWNNWNDRNGDFSLPSGESFDNAAYPDINIGISWRHKTKNLMPRAGFSLAHINKPDKFFYDDSEKLGMRMLADIGLTYDLNDKLMITPQILANLGGGINKTITGLDLSWEFKGSKPVRRIFGGVYLNNGIIEKTSSVMLNLGAQVKRIEVSLGYEQRMGLFGEATGTTGAFEIALVYKSISTYLNTYSIPCERF